MKNLKSINKKSQGLFLFILATFVSVKTQAQKDFFLYGFDDLAQSQIVNPAFKPSSKVFVAMPVINSSLGFSHSGFQLNQLLQTRSQDDSLVLNPANALSKMKDLNNLTFDMRNELFSFGFSAKETFITFSLTNKFQTRFMYPKDLFRLAVEGNGGSLLGERASLDGLGFGLLSYMEVGLGVNRSFGDKLTLGVKVKYLQGLANIQTDTKLGLTTDATTFELTVDGQLKVNSSNFAQLADSNSTGFDPKQLINGNKGFGIDLGAEYQLTEKLKINGSVIDLGSIKWDSNAKTYESSAVEYKFEGIDLNQFLSDSSDVMKTITDSLEQVLTVSDNTDAYRTGLYTRIYIGAKYQIMERVAVGGVWYSEFLQNKYKTAITLSGDIKLTKWFRAGVNYTAYARDYKTIGLGFTINGGPFQLYLMTDNIVGVLAPQASKNWHVRTGINFIFGRDKKEKDTKASMED